MKTFEQFAAPTRPENGYLAYELSDSSRQTLLNHFKAKYPETVCHHVTVKFPAKSTDDLPPAVREAHVVGYADSGDGIEALVVEVNGSTKRHDGKLFHITLSLDRKKGKKPVHSNELLSKGFTSVAPIKVQLEPMFFKA